MAEDFDNDVVIVGSGFGGSVAAAVLAEGGLKVCVLERGRAYPPGSFPRSPQGMRTNFWDPSEGSHGLFQLWSLGRTDSLTCSGLGGGSLIYANVMLRKPENSYVRWDWRNKREVVEWPVAPAALRRSYRWVERRIGVSPLPPTRTPGFDVVRRTDALERVSTRLNDAGFPTTFERPPVAVSFGPPNQPPQPGAPIAAPHNVHTALTQIPTHRVSCLLCGECDLGCNYGSKNSLDHTLLSQACAADADIRPLHEVTGLERDGRGWRVIARDRSRLDEAGMPPPHRFDGVEVTIRARRVVLAAGTFGTTHMLLRLRGKGLEIGDALGQCFSGNGDYIGWIRRSPVRLDGDRGPVVTSLMRTGGTRPAADGQRVPTVSYVQDGGYPVLLAWLAETLNLAGPGRLLRFAGRRWWAAFRKDPNRGLAKDASRLIGTERATGTLPLLGVGTDVADGRLTLGRRNNPKLLAMSRPSGRSDAYYEAVSDTMARISAALGARLLESPWWSLRRSVTVHPLGGCPMGETGDDGVVDEWGEVFGHDGLYVMDGSVMPGSVGPNPALTIAAFAERASRHLLDQAEND